MSQTAGIGGLASIRPSDVTVGAGMMTSSVSSAALLALDVTNGPGTEGGPVAGASTRRAAGTALVEDEEDELELDDGSAPGYRRAAGQ